jgi:anti-anti-sigma regulatory factor
VMVSEHDVYDDGTLRITYWGSPPVVILSGDIDEATWPGLVSVLEDAADEQAEVHFDFGGVGYCDLAGLRAIIGVTCAGRDGEGGPRRVVLHQVPPELEKVLRILGWDATPGLALHGPADHSGPASLAG